MKPTLRLLLKVSTLHDSVVLQSSDKILCVGRGLGEYARGLAKKTGANSQKV